jgi:hypothetical protein
VTLRNEALNCGGAGDSGIEPQTKGNLAEVNCLTSEGLPFVPTIDLGGKRDPTKSQIEGKPPIIVCASIEFQFTSDRRE